ncbi:DUF637 domain-containing protein [Erwinia sp. Leaf53]|uniref:two-partner secretion domain-containing protein n=1 Tax=Erwinia sp. Leaf53 TaxID=1736225 RepID=UPI000B0154FE|nr:DUF637 domain-containing protein [Erwinia sp. Leaf53]
MDKLNNPLARGASYLLIYLTALQPLNPAIAAGITAAVSGTQVQSGTVPVVNIAPPNGAGISHNTYKDFNVATPGAVLNNATAAGKSQLAGQLNANLNLKGKAAELIINEVTGASRSELNGKLEVFGSKANVMIANPNGITCDGCGFINTPAVTLTTGKPVMGKDGTMEALEVKKGSVVIGSKGLDGNNADYVDIISRATEMNGKINAKTLSLTQGANRISYVDGTLKPVSGEGTKPQLAVDTKALGGMYAGKIRLVATEEGVGVNLRDLTTNQKDISLSVKGLVAFTGSAQVKTDLNITAKELQISSASSIKAGRDITVDSPRLANEGQFSSAEDMRIFSDEARTTGEKTLIQAGKNLWIQKDATGNKSTYLTNLSGTIKTTTGDLIIRTNRLDNDRHKLVVAMATAPKDNKDFDRYAGAGFYNHPTDFVGFDYTADIDDKSFKWVGHIDFKKSLAVNSDRETWSVISDNKPAEISAGSNAYINASELRNRASEIKSGKDLIITGGNLEVITESTGTYNEYANFERITNPEPPLYHYNPTAPRSSYFKDDPANAYFLLIYSQKGKEGSWSATANRSSLLQAGGNLTADFNNSIISKSNTNYNPASVSDITSIENPVVFSANNILLNSKNITLSEGLKATGDITLIAGDKASVKESTWTAGGAISLAAGSNIDLLQSNLKAQDITLISREGDIKSATSSSPSYFRTDGTRWQTNLDASRDLTLSAGKSITLNNALLSTQGRNISMTSAGNISLVRDDAILQRARPMETLPATKAQEYFNKLLTAGAINVTDSVLINSGGDLALRGVNIKAGKDITLLAGKSVDLSVRPLGEQFDPLFANVRVAELRSTVNASGNLLLSAAQNITAQGASLAATGNATLMAGKDLLLSAVAWSAIDSQNDNNKDDRNLTASLKAGKALTAAANENFIATGTEFTSGSDMTLSSGGKMEFNAVASHIYRERSDGYSEEVTQQNSKLNSGGVLTLLSNGSILFQATSLIAKGAMDVAAKGGFLYAQAMEESSSYEKTTTSRKWYGKKTTIKQTSHKVTNKVTEFTADGNINLLSRDDSTYQASKINAGKNATLTSTNGKVIFEAVKNTTFEQRITNSKGFWIKNADKGYTESRWIMPSVYTGGILTVNAATGITADIKTKNAQSLNEAVTLLGNTTGTDWLKGLNTRKDVQWQPVQDAYNSWDYKSQSLNPVASAIIAVAVAAVTAGTGLAAWAGEAAVTASGSAAATTAGAAAYGVGAAGMTALTSQAAVALVENKGNLSKTLQALGSSSSVKSLATSMVVGGTLAGFDQAVFGINATASSTKLPLLSKGDWGKIVQRVAGQSILSSSLNTTINGGSFKDQLTSALLSNVADQINAEGAKFVGDRGGVLGIPGKTLSHMVVSGIAAEIGQGNVKGAVAGALAAELAGIIINDNLFKTVGWRERDAQISRVAGALAGALATNQANGVNSGANAAEIIERFNRQLHQDELIAIKELSKGDKISEEKLLAASCRQTNCTYQEALSSVERDFYDTLMKKYPITLYEDSILSDYWVSKSKNRYGNYPAHTENYIEQLFTYTVNDSITDSETFAKNQWISEARNKFGLSNSTLTSVHNMLAVGAIVLGSRKGNVNGRPITLENGFYVADGLKISTSYYDRLWQQGRKAPFLQAREILNSNPKVMQDPRGAPGYMRYEVGGIEMVYNPTTGQIGHIQPLKK